jgi:hypothetical protein
MVAGICCKHLPVDYWVTIGKQLLVNCVKKYITKLSSYKNSDTQRVLVNLAPTLQIRNYFTADPDREFQI